jgi:hypothetical protein
LAAGLKADAQLCHQRVADEPVMHIHVTLTARTADNQASRAYSWEDGVRIAIIEEYGAFSRMLEKLDGLVVFAGAGDACSQ